MANFAVAVFGSALTPHQYGPVFGQFGIVPSDFVFGTDLRMTVGQEQRDPKSSNSYYLSGYFVTRIAADELVDYFANNFEMPEIPDEFAEVMTAKMRASYAVKTIQSLKLGGGSSLLIWKPNQKDSDIPGPIVNAVIHSWNKFAASLVEDGYIIESNKINVASGQHFSKGTSGSVPIRQVDQAAQILTFDADAKTSTNVANLLATHGDIELRSINIKCGHLVDPFEHDDG